MSTEEDIELHFAPSDADDMNAILEVSPVNSYNRYSTASPTETQSAASPTASLRHRRSQNNEHAFSSSSDGSTDEEEDDYDYSKESEFYSCILYKWQCDEEINIKFIEVGVWHDHCRSMFVN